MQEQLQLAGAKEVRDALAWYPFARLIEVRSQESTITTVVEVVIFEIEPELPQHREYDIRSVEKDCYQCLVRMTEDISQKYLHMRKDFPHVYHTFFGHQPTRPKESLLVRGNLVGGENVVGPEQVSWAMLPSGSLVQQKVSGIPKINLWNHFCMEVLTLLCSPRQRVRLRMKQNTTYVGSVVQELPRTATFIA